MEKNNKLLRLYITQILKERQFLKENDYGGGDGAPDFAQSTYHGGGGGFSGDGIFSKAFAPLINATTKGIHDVGNAVYDAGIKTLSLGWLMTNPWSASLFGDEWTKHYLSTVEKGTNNDIIIQGLKSHLYNTYDVPLIIGAVKSAGIPTITLAAGYLIDLVKRDPSTSPFIKNMALCVNKIKNEMPNMPEDMQKIFSIDKDSQQAFESYLYITMNEIKNKKNVTKSTIKSPIVDDVDDLVVSAKSFMADPQHSNKEIMMNTFVADGMDKTKAKELSSFISNAAK